MKKRNIIIMILMPLMMLLPAAAFMEPAYACGTSSSAQEVGSGVGETDPTDTTCGANGIQTAISTAVQVLSIVVGAAAVVAIINAGFKYVTSGGEASKVSNAKNTLIYALVGIAIAVLAQLLVRFVITQATTAIPCPTNPAISTGDPTCKPKKS